MHLVKGADSDQLVNCGSCTAELSCQFDFTAELSCQFHLHLHSESFYPAELSSQFLLQMSLGSQYVCPAVQPTVSRW